MAQIASKSDKPLVIDIITSTFLDNPSVNRVIKPDAPSKRLAHLANFVFEYAWKRDGVFLSDDKSGVAVCFHNNYKKDNLKDYWEQIKLVKNAIGFNRVFSTLARESYLKKHKIDNEFLYFWFFGVKRQGQGTAAAFDLQRRIFELSDQKKLPIVLETSVPKNKKVYERFGFDTYHTWHDDDINLWFMRRSPLKRTVR